MNKKEIINMAKRIEKLEAAVFGLGLKRVVTLKKNNYKGPTGGIKFLIDKGFLNNKQPLAGIRAKLSENGYHYSIQAAQTALNRLSKLGGPIVALKEGGKKLYVKRK
jgi:hypothetical protein